MKIHRGTAAALAGIVLVIAALAAWGEHLGMSEGSLRWVQGAAGAIGSLVLALLPRLFRDADGDGVPDILRGGGAALLVALLGASVSGCGAQLSDSQRASLATETQRCLIAEREIVDEPCGDLAPAECRARDMDALRAERARCDAARAAIVGGE